MNLAKKNLPLGVQQQEQASASKSSQTVANASVLCSPRWRKRRITCVGGGVSATDAYVSHRRVDRMIYIHDVRPTWLLSKRR